jgi:hypothetical protein
MPRTSLARNTVRALLITILFCVALRGTTSAAAGTVTSPGCGGTRSRPATIRISVATTVAWADLYMISGLGLNTASRSRG